MNLNEFSRSSFTNEYNIVQSSTFQVEDPEVEEDLGETETHEVTIKDVGAEAE